MAGALIFLAVRSAQNAVAAWVRRLRQPRYAIGFGAALLYFYGFFMRRAPTRSGRQGFGGLADLISRYHGVLEVAIASVLLAITALVWLWPASSRAGLKFSPAERQFLFPAPITRRLLVHYKVLRACVRPVLSAAFMTVMFRPGSLAGALMILAGTVVLIEMENLYLIGVALRRQPGAASRRLWALRVAAVGAFAVVAVTVGLDWRSLAAAASARDVVTELERLGTTGAAGVVLLPFRALADLPLAPTPAAFLRAMPAALTLLVLAYLWAVRADISTEDAPVDQRAAQRRPASGPAVRSESSASMRVPFELGGAGRPETALLWKNIISTSRVAWRKALLRVLPVLVALMGVAAVAAPRSRGGTLVGLVAILCVAVAGYTVLFGPLLLRNDLRQDLAHLATLKAWPLRGAVIVRGEVLAPAAILTAIACLFLAGALMLSSSLRFAAPLPWLQRVSFAISAALLVPGLILTQVVIHNAVALIFPAWANAFASQSRGVDVAGQRLVMMAGLVLTLALACVPAALAAGLVGVAIRAVIGGVPLVVPAAVALVVLLLECGIATESLGVLFERTDIGALQS